MNNEDNNEFEIKDALKKIKLEASASAPESNWIGVLGRSETISIDEKTAISTLKRHKLLSAAASVLVVALISITLFNSLTSNEVEKIKTADPGKKITETTVPQTSSSTVTTEVQISTTTSKQTTTTTKTPTTTAAPTPSRPANPSNLQYTGNDDFGGGDPGTYNVYFSWSPSSTPGVKYCVGTTSYGSSQIFPNCTWSNQSLETGTSVGFGLGFSQNTTYRFQVTAIDSNNQKSDTIYLDWQIPG